jgi:hypothetical protein
MAEAQLNLSIQLISCSNVPIGNQIRRNSDPYCRVFAVGPTKVLLGRTHTIDGKIDVEWNASPISTNAVRGIRLFFEVYDEETPPVKDQLLAVGGWDPNFREAGIQNLELQCLKKFEKRREGPCVLRFSVSFELKSEPIPRPGPSHFPTVIYLTVACENQSDVKLPFDSVHRGESHGVLPYVFPYGLSVTLLNESAKQCNIVASGSRSMAGAWHSGRNVCAGCRTLSPCVQLDPAALVSAGYTKLLVSLSTADFGPLRGSLGGPASVVAWTTREKALPYNKKLQRLTLVPNLSPAASFPIDPSGVESTVVCAVGVLSGPGVLDLSPVHVGLPTPQLEFSTQCIGDVIPLVANASKVSNVSFPTVTEFPLFVPRSLNLVTVSNGAMEVSARAPAYKQHSLQLHMLEANHQPVYTLDDKSPAAAGAMYSPGTITAKLSEVPSPVTLLLFIVFGEGKFADEPSRADPAKQQMSVVVNNRIELVKTKYKYSYTKNTLLWCALARDGFGGWAFVNVRVALYAEILQEAGARFKKIVEDVLKMP